AVRQAGARIVRLLASTATRHDVRGPIHRALQAAWAPRRDAVGEVIRTALVLCADHELNVSTFTARCAASAGASPYDVVSAALASCAPGRIWTSGWRRSRGPIVCPPTRPCCSLPSGEPLAGSRTPSRRTRQAGSSVRARGTRGPRPAVPLDILKVCRAIIA